MERLRLPFHHRVESDTLPVVTALPSAGIRVLVSYAVILPLSCHATHGRRVTCMCSCTLVTGLVVTRPQALLNMNKDSSLNGGG